MRKDVKHEEKMEERRRPDAEDCENINFFDPWGDQFRKDVNSLQTEFEF